MTLTPMDRTFKQKISKETVVLKDTIDQLNLIDIYRSLHPKPVEYKSFSRVHGTFSRIDHMPYYKIILSLLEKVEIITNIFSDHSDMTLEINDKKKTAKNTNIWRLNNMLLNKQWDTEKIKKEIKNTWI